MNVIDLDWHAPLPEPYPKTIDMLPPRWEEPGVRALRFLSFLILISLRERGDSLLLRTSGEGAQLWMSVDVPRDGVNSPPLQPAKDDEATPLWMPGSIRWVEMTSPPLHVATGLLGMVWFLGRPRRRAWGHASLLRELDRHQPAAPGPPWESQFRARLGDGSLQVVAKAEAISGAVDLVLRLVDVMIDQPAARAKLQEVFPE